MLVRRLRVVVDEQRGHDEVLRDPVRVVLAERLELGTGGRVEVARRDALVDLGVLVPRADRLGAVRVAVLPVVACRLTEASAGVPGAVTEAGPRAVVVVATGPVVAAEGTTFTFTLRTTVVTTGTVGAVPVTRGTTVIATAAEGTTLPVTLRTTVVTTRAVRTVAVTGRTTVVTTAAEGTTLAVTRGTTVIATAAEGTTVIATAAEGTTLPVTLRTTVVTTGTVRTVAVTRRTTVIATGTVRTVAVTRRTTVIATGTVRTV
ncbi:hypothetical protein, partial [Curtobacterium sp. ME26]|uniref:hypothetical protein n=1 Tax=Curtobacterium sp. ME26 TaxID=2744254 RepID=UPI001C71580C